jgi:voltage-gated potassium channel
MTNRQRIPLALSLLVAVLFGGTLGFHAIEGWSWFDGFYMTLTTMTTIGYGEIHPLSHIGRVFNSFLIVTAVLAGAFTLGTLTQALLEFEFGKALGRRRMERELSRMSDHYIVCGAGRVGRTVLRELRAGGQSCVVIEKDGGRARWAESEKIPLIVGNASSEEVLQKARIGTAKGLVAAVGSDAENLYIVLTARGFRPDLKIIARASEEEAAPKLLRAGASQVLSPYHFIGHRIAQMLLRPNVLDFVDAAVGSDRLDIDISEVRVAERSALVGKSLTDPWIRAQANVVVLAVRGSDGKMLFNPSPESTIHPGDCLIVIGGDEEVKRFDALAS